MTLFPLKKYAKLITALSKTLTFTDQKIANQNTYYEKSILVINSSLVE
jgi:hypothetical protein